jgi:hypothetical protein
VASGGSSFSSLDGFGTARLTDGFELAIPKWKEKKMTPRRGFSALLLTALALISVPRDAPGEGAEGPLQLEAKIPLGDIRGRIDHMAVDLARQRLFVAALGNDGLAVVDLQTRRLDRLIGELAEPAGCRLRSGN